MAWSDGEGGVEKRRASTSGEVQTKWREEARSVRCNKQEGKKESEMRGPTLTSIYMEPW